MRFSVCDLALSTLHTKLLPNSPPRYFIRFISRSLAPGHFRAACCTFIAISVTQFLHYISGLYIHIAWHWTLISSPIMLLSICLSVVGTWHHLLVAGDPPDPLLHFARLQWLNVSVSRYSCVISKRHVNSGYEWAYLAPLLTLPLPGLIMPQNTVETINELIAGSFGGAAQVLVGQPLDTIKTRAQIAPSSVSCPLFHELTILSCVKPHRGHVC